MAGFGEILQTSGQENFMNLFGAPMGKPTGESFGRSMSDVVATPDSPSAMSDAQGNMPTTDDGISNETMGAIMGTAQALSGLMGQFDAVKNQRSALKIKQIQNRINARFAKANFERKMTGLFQAHRDLEEQSMQQHTQREAAYQQKMGSMKVIQAERGMAGTSATETKDALTRSNLLAEQVMLGNMKKAQRSLMYQREGIADQRLAEELGFDMSNANIASQMQTPAWAQILAGAPDLAIGGFNTYFNFVRNTGRGGDVT